MLSQFKIECADDRDANIGTFGEHDALRRACDENLAKFSPILSFKIKESLLCPDSTKLYDPVSNLAGISLL